MLTRQFKSHFYIYGEQQIRYVPVWFKHIYSYNEYKHINKQYITMVYDGIQKKAIRLIRICVPGMSLGLQSTGESFT